MEWLDVSQTRIEHLFTQKQPLEVEIGCGKGAFLVERAQEHPEANFIAIDRIWKFMKVGKYRAQRRNLDNICFLKTEAWDFVSSVLENESVAIFHVYFPDPWMKRRHHKRRLLEPEFMRLLSRKTAPSGLLEIATDNEAYYHHIIESISSLQSYWILERQQHNERLFPATRKTNYERKYEKEGRNIYHLELRRVADLIE